MCVFVRVSIQVRERVCVSAIVFFPVCLHVYMSWRVALLCVSQCVKASVHGFVCAHGRVCYVCVYVCVRVYVRVYVCGASLCTCVCVLVCLCLCLCLCVCLRL